jgi:hypothetical protein
MKKVLFSLVAMLLLSSGIAQTTFTKVTSASGLEAGANYLIVAHYDDLGVLAMGYQKTSNRHAVVVDETSDAITVTLGTDPASETDVFQFTLGGSEGAWTLYDEVKGGYLYASSSSANNLKTQTELDANGQWSITFNADGTAEVIAQGENTRNNMRFNPNTSNNAPLFSCYGETSNIDTRVSFYKAGGEPATPDPEPSNYPTDFHCLTNADGLSITLDWTDSEGGQLPAKYLVLASTGDITVPVDGTPVADGELAKNVAYGVETVTFSGLQGGAGYHFAIFPYTNGGSNINYKTDGTYPTTIGSTEQIITLFFEDFDEDLGVFTPYNIVGEQEWHHGEHQGTTFANMNGYADGASNENEDWLVSPAISSQGNQDALLSFRTAMKFDGDPLQVKVSIDYDGQGDPVGAEWIDITDEFEYSTGNYEWVESGAVNVWNVFDGYDLDYPNFYVAFVYKSTTEAASSWEIDYVKVISYGAESVAEQNNTIGLYPNPASEQVSFVLESDAQVSVFDMTGRMVNQKNMTAGEAQLNVSDFQSGVYFVNIRYANGTTAVSKFVKF